MAHGLNSVLKRGPSSVGCNKSEGKTGIGSRRIFAPHFKLQVLDSYRNDSDCKGNQRATARKYGIHRRQIQKWLQVETNLRNSVGKCKLENNGSSNSENPEARKCAEAALANRQRDDSGIGSGLVAYSEPRVPSLSPVTTGELPAPSPWMEDGCNTARSRAFEIELEHQRQKASATVSPLDFSMTGRGQASPSVASACSPPPVSDPSAPIDLSLKKVGVTPAGALLAAPVPPVSPHTPSPLPLPASRQSPHSLPQQALSDSDVWDLSVKPCVKSEDTSYHMYTSPPPPQTPKPVKLFKPYLDDMSDDSNSNKAPHHDDVDMPFHPDLNPPPPCCSSSAYLVHPTCENPFYNNNNNTIMCEIRSEYTYTLHEMQTKSYYYSPPPAVYPVTAEYEASDFCPTYEDISYSQPLKHRQSYSLDFKLSAIDCYYQDSLCRGNQRAVATKYNIHRRQVQKWLKQADELRQRNENIKQINAVS